MSEKSKEALEKMQMHHLAGQPPAEDLGKLKEQIETQAQKATGDPEVKEEEPQEDPRTNRLYPFEFSWKNQKGEVYKGSFVNQILSIRDRHTIGVMRAQLLAGVPLESVDILTREINLIVAHLTTSLVESPDWASDLWAIDDVSLLQAIYQEVLDHEEIFHGPGTLKKEGKK